ncbi:MAG: hypothetical protein A7316_02365 [Candidatus Altiarchaeales archaeon WOR_SM1_86-2]|nr:MAG: hypothetical protein A7316_02365 [Candidatus Altiarchaeales archaeon WOR_SM1_86-2]
MDDHFIVFATKNGVVKKTEVSAFSNPRVTGIRAINIDDGDELIGVCHSDGDSDIILATKNGKAVRFNEKNVRAMGRTARGVRGIRLRKGDEVVSMVSVSKNDIERDINILSITENGYGKQTPLSKYRRIKRGGMGIITIITNERNGGVVNVKAVDGDDELLITSVDGMVIRIPVSGISTQGRNTMGVRIMRLKEDDKVAGVAKLV